jgi:hypothetical protein
MAPLPRDHDELSPTAQLYWYFWEPSGVELSGGEEPNYVDEVICTAPPRLRDDNLWLLPLAPPQEHSQGDPPPVVVEANPTEPLPCGPPPTKPMPAGVDINQVRRLAQEAGRILDGLRNGNEWGILGYRTHDGVLRLGPPETYNRPDKIGFNFNKNMPDGATLVFDAHSHPPTRLTNQGLLSEEDVRGRETTIKAAQGKPYSVAPNFIRYIFVLGTRELREFPAGSIAERPGTNVTTC